MIVDRNCDNLVLRERVMNNENSTSDPFERRPFGEQDEPSYQAYRDSALEDG